MIPVAVIFTSNLILNLNYVDFMNFSILSALEIHYYILKKGMQYWTLIFTLVLLSLPGPPLHNGNGH